MPVASSLKLIVIGDLPAPLAVTPCRLVLYIRLRTVTVGTAWPLLLQVRLPTGCSNFQVKNCGTGSLSVAGSDRPGHAHPPRPPRLLCRRSSPPAPPPPPFAAAPPQLPPLRRPPSAAAAPDDSTAGLHVRGRRVQMCRAALSSTATGSARSLLPHTPAGRAVRRGRGRRQRSGPEGGKCGKGGGGLASLDAIAVSLAKEAGASDGA